MSRTITKFIKHLYKIMYSEKYLKSILDKIPYSKKAIKEFLRLVRNEPKFTKGKLSGDEIIELIGIEDPVILDIGSNDGTHTLWFLDLFKNCKVYSFEPDPRAKKRYKENVNDKRTELIEVAISDVDDEIEFFISSGYPSPEVKKEFTQGWDLSGSIRKPKNHYAFYPWCTFDNKIKIKTSKLDTWFDNKNIETIDFIWADVQGAEADLIKGGRKTLNRTRYFYTEYSNWELYEGQFNLRQLMDLLPDFEVIYRYEADVLFKNKNYQ